MNQFFKVATYFIAISTEAVAGNLETLTGFLEGFLEASSDGHDFTNRFHLEAKAGIGPMEFIKVKARNFYDDVIQGGFKEGTGGLGNGVLQFIEVETNGQFRRNFRNGITGCF